MKWDFNANIKRIIRLKKKKNIKIMNYSGKT